MKEVTKWNGKPRWMWVWDDDEETKRLKEYVLCILTEKEMEETEALYPVRAVNNNFEHCAEIEEESKKETRLTLYELSQLLKCFGVNYSLGSNTDCYNNLGLLVEKENNELTDSYKIRYKQGEWEEPTRETVLKWWKAETPAADLDRFISVMGWSKDTK